MLSYRNKYIFFSVNIQKIYISKIFYCFFYVNRALSKIHQLFGEFTESSELEEETLADLAAGNRLSH